MKNNLVLLGMMGVGKTTLGKIVAKRLGLEFIDIDSSIEKENSMVDSIINDLNPDTINFENLEKHDVHLKQLPFPSH